MVAMTPLIAIQILGLVYRIKLAKAERAAELAAETEAAASAPADLTEGAPNAGSVFGDDDDVVDL
jgi:hypothetical protein